jgi:hypothetical protein
VAELERSDGLETGANLGFQQKWWRLEQVIYGVMTVLLLAGLAGVFGRGPLSRAKAGNPSMPLSADYERFARFRTPTLITVHLGPQITRGRRVALRLTGPINDRIPVSRIIPQPRSASPIADGQQFTFDVPTPGDSASVRMILEPGKVGMSHASIGVEGAPTLGLSQFVYP